jgi:Mg2+ and Co2+ transporter CorA
MLILLQAFQVSQRPRRRLLREFFSLSEEIGAILSIMEKQDRVIQDFRCVLAPSSLRITSHTRHSQYALENRLLHKSSTSIKKKMAQYLELKQQVDRQINLTKMGIEILDDDHGKAILVFTVVTLVFLPLSFVTSYLGMNTADIRNQNATQEIFWEIAAPLTAAVIGLALLVGYKFEAMREWVRSHVSAKT